MIMNEISELELTPDSDSTTTRNSTRSNDPYYSYDSIIGAAFGELNRYSLRVILMCQFGIMVVIGAVMAAPLYHSILPRWKCSGARDISSPEHDCNCTNRQYYHASGFYLYAERFELVCDREKYQNLTGELTIGSGMIGALVFGQLADNFGRKPAGFISLGGSLLGSFVFVFSPSYIASCLFSSLAGFFAGGHLVVIVVMAMEFVGPRYRLLVACFHGVPYGLMYMGFMGFITKDWRYYHLSMALTGLPFLLSWAFVCESPRWLIQMNELHRAEKVLEKIARFSGFKSSPVSQKQIQDLYDAENKPRRKKMRFNYLDLVRYPSIRRNTLAVLFLWTLSSCMSFSFYESLDGLVGIMYLNVFLTGLAQAVAGISPLVLNSWFGRRSIMMIGIILVGLITWSAALVLKVHSGSDDDGVSIVMGLSIGAVAIMDLIWKTNYLYATELFPTVVRCMANSVVTIGAGFGDFVARMLVFKLSGACAASPYITLGILAIVQLIFVFFVLPETKDQPLPDGITEAATRRGARIHPSTQSNGAANQFSIAC